MGRGSDSRLQSQKDLGVDAGQTGAHSEPPFTDLYRGESHSTCLQQWPLLMAKEETLRALGGKGFPQDLTEEAFCGRQILGFVAEKLNLRLCLLVLMGGVGV